GLLTRRGALEEARRTLAAGLADAEAAGLDAGALRARLGRLLVTAGRFAEALAIVEPALAARAQAGAPRALALETALLASAYLGDLERARAHLAAPGAGVAGTRPGYLPA